MSVQTENKSSTLSTPAGPARESASLPCVHCGEPTHCAVDHDPGEVFCCHGCAGAYQLIHGLGLENFYALRDQAKVSGAASPAEQQSRYDQFDSPEFLGRSTPQTRPDGTQCSTFALQGLHCAACAWLIENAANREPGLLSTRVKMSEHTIQLVFDPKQTQLSRIARLLDRLGYQLSPFDPSRQNHLQAENRQQLTQIAISGFLAANAMWIAIALYAGASLELASQHGYFLGLVGSALGVAAVAGPGRKFFVSALASIRTRTPHMDLPIALGLSVGTIVGSINALTGQGHVYFDSMSTLVFLLLIGRWIQFRQQQRAAKAVDLMLRITPKHATKLTEHGASKQVLVASLVAGDIIEVLSGDSIPADGKIIALGSDNSATSTTLDCSLLSGESQPVRVWIGDTVAAGTLNLGVPIQIQVAAVGPQSRIGKVMQAVESAGMEKTPIVQLADRIGGYFVVAVTLLAIGTFAFWAMTGVGVATTHATALLIVACPCALALATPLAIAVGLGRAAQSGILIRDGNTFQLMSDPGRLWFDKTGTLTEGKQSVTSLIGSPESLALAASVEQHCKHPVASAIARETQLRQLEIDKEGSLQETLPGGVRGKAAGREVAIGNAQLMQQLAIKISPQLRQHASDLAAAGESPIWIAVDGQAETVLGLADPIRTGAKEVLAKLQQAGWKLGILSGDHSQIVQRVAAQLDLPQQDCMGDLTPEQKLAWIKQSGNDYDTVVMVGDGANDAAALALADVGIAVRGGAEVSLQAAPVYVTTGRLQSLLDLAVGSRRTQQLIRSTFAISLSYNLLAVALAMTGWITPLTAAVLMPISSVSVLGITLATRTFPATSTMQEPT